MTKYSKGSQDKVEEVMREFKQETLKSGKDGKGGIVKSRKQAVAIGLSEARKEREKVSKKKTEKSKSKSHAKIQS